MAHITEISQSKRLKEFGINIKTKYKTKEKNCERNTDHSKNDDVENGIRLEKRYYKHGNVLYKSNNFDSRILYTFLSASQEQETYVCPNCGAVVPLSDIEEGCPYCGTFFNMEYTHKDLGTKHSYDRTMKGSHYVKITLLVDVIVSFLISLLYITVSGRNFNVYDISKVLVGTLVLSAVLFYVFYYLDALFILLPIKIYKDRLNQKQIEFWERMKQYGIEKEKFYNNFNYEISKYYFEKSQDVIDYDILDYNTLQEQYHKNQLSVHVNATIRIIHYCNNKISAIIEKQDFELIYKGRSNLNLSGGVNTFSCKNCGASIDATQNVCPYCNTKYESVQEWYLKDLHEV